MPTFFLYIINITCTQKKHLNVVFIILQKLLLFGSSAKYYSSKDDDGKCLKAPQKLSTWIYIFEIVTISTR